MREMNEMIPKEQKNTKSQLKIVMGCVLNLQKIQNPQNKTLELHLPWTNCGSQNLKASMAGDFFLNSSSLSKLYLSTSA